MVFFEWRDAFSVQIAQIDQQHRRLIELVNDLHAAIERSNELATMEAVLSEIDTVVTVIGELIRYASYHFTTEEDYMTEYAYPGYDDHRRQHQSFIGKIDAYKRSFEKERTRISIDIATFIRQWWEVHILDSDKKCGAFLYDKGLR